MLSKLLHFLKNILFIITIVVLTLVLFEGLFRLMGLKPAQSGSFQMSFTKPDPVIGFRSQANAKWWVDMTPQGAYVARYKGSTDNQGYRPMIMNAGCKDCKTMVALGDSMTFGIESSNDTTWPELLAKRLTEQGKPYKVRNISYRGWGTFQQALALEEYIKNGGKADAVLLMVVTNDATDNIGRFYYPSAPILQEENGQIQPLPPIDSPDLNKTARVWRNEQWIRKSAVTTYFYRKGGASLIGEEEPLFNFDFSDNNYRSIMWSKESYESLYQSLSILSSSDPESQLKQKAFLYSLNRIKAACDKIGSRLFITTTPAFALKNGKNSNSLQTLLKMQPHEFNDFADKWAKHHADVSNFSKKIGAIYINNSNSLDELNYHQYAAQPVDWHSSTESNVFQSRMIANELINSQQLP